MTAERLDARSRRVGECPRACPVFIFLLLLLLYARLIYGCRVMNVLTDGVEGLT